MASKHGYRWGHKRAPLGPIAKKRSVPARLQVPGPGAPFEAWARFRNDLMALMEAGRISLATHRRLAPLVDRQLRYARRETSQSAWSPLLLALDLHGVAYETHEPWTDDD